MFAYVSSLFFSFCFFFQAEDGIRELVRSRGLGDVYKRQEYSLRGCDAVYAAVARRFGSVLVTLGRGQLERAAVAVETQTPRQAMRHLGR